MSTTWSNRREPQPTVKRFRQVFDRYPTAHELGLFQSSHHALVLGAPARARPTLARLISRG